MKVIVSGGGTAGHINPALAVAEALREKGHEVLFVGAEGKMEMERVPKAGFPIEGLPVVGLQRRFALSNFALPFKLIKSLSRARQIIKEFHPDVVVGFGGYASAPIVRQAQKMGIRTLLQEQNSFAGLTNRALACKAEKICVAYEGMDKFFPADKIVLTGNPMRSSLGALPDKLEACLELGLNPKLRTILVIGGSLGTRTLNEMVVATALPTDVQMIWQCGKYYFEEMQKRAPQKMPKAFIERMDYAYAAADVVITRAGASTVSELQLVAKAAIFVPSPVVTQDHQTHNAMSLVNRGAAMMIKDEDASEKGIKLALELLNDVDKIRQIEQRIHVMAKPNATQEVVNIIING